jgi:cysteine synthase
MSVQGFLMRHDAAIGDNVDILIFAKDEAANPSGSFKDRRAALSVHEAKIRGFQGVVAATSGNYDLILDATAAAGAIRVGDEIAFALNDSALLAAMTAPYVAKRPVGAAM